MRLSPLSPESPLSHGQWPGCRWAQQVGPAWVWLPIGPLKSLGLVAAGVCLGLEVEDVLQRAGDTCFAFRSSPSTGTPGSGHPTSACPTHSLPPFGPGKSPQLPQREPPSPPPNACPHQSSSILEKPSMTLGRHLLLGSFPELSSPLPFSTYHSMQDQLLPWARAALEAGRLWPGRGV